MNWRIGDKVRLTGPQWGSDKDDEVYEGAILEVTGIRDEDIRFETSGYYWVLHEGWEIELVERKEETMSVDFSEVNVGDKVRLTRENGDETTFTVEGVWTNSIRSASNSFQGSSWDTLEIVERAFKPVPGLYSNKKFQRAMLAAEGEMYFTAEDGAWIRVDSDHRLYEEVARGKKGWMREVTF